MLTAFDGAISPEELRPKLHFTAPSGWLNDPNGLVYKDGIYHLFYQHNPFGTQWGNMTWGHATSRDLFHWEHHPNALEPDRLGTIFSGSAVIDSFNSGGFGKDAMVLVYTAAGGTSDLSKDRRFTQCLAHSSEGKTFAKLDLNPIVTHIEAENRDPKVFWHAPTKRWMMVLYLNEDRFAILGSDDLKTWRRLSELRLPGSSECPDLFQLPLDGDKNKMMWVFWAAGGDYQVGQFDGVTFTPSSAVRHSAFGNTGYAAQTYSNAPKGRTIQIAWYRGAEFPNCPWNQELGLPNELSLRTTAEGPTLCFWPVAEVNKLRRKKLSEVDGMFAGRSPIFDFSGKWTIPDTGSIEFELNGIPAKFDAKSRIFECLGRTLTLSPSKDLELRAMGDTATADIYLQRGEFWMPMFALPTAQTEFGVKVKIKGIWKGSMSAHTIQMEGVPR
ncbi:MAG: glycoside hydrolase family 32 protein [Armatimonadetes bacterium]|nr:glycoside hydrolase family 32 protein [Armatimonadota bacterium]